MPDRPAQPLVQSVEDLSRHGYAVLTCEQFEEACVLLGALALGGDVDDAERRATELLSTFPEGRADA